MLELFLGSNFEVTAFAVSTLKVFNIINVMPLAKEVTDGGKVIGNVFVFAILTLVLSVTNATACRSFNCFYVGMLINGSCVNVATTLNSTSSLLFALFITSLIYRN
jgi:hypothetical protein